MAQNRQEQEAQSTGYGVGVGSLPFHFHALSNPEALPIPLFGIFMEVMMEALVMDSTSTPTLYPSPPATHHPQVGGGAEEFHLSKPARASLATSPLPELKGSRAPGIASAHQKHTLPGGSSSVLGTQCQDPGTKPNYLCLIKPHYVYVQELYTRMSTQKLGQEHSE